MKIINPKIVPCLWFDNQAEDAAKYYTSIFSNLKVKVISRYGKEGYEIHKQPDGSVMTVEFEIAGQSFIALNGGPLFKFTEAISFQVFCEDQEEVNELWSKLTNGGNEKAQQCGWLKDKYGISWQIIPKDLGKYISGSDPIRSQRAMKVMLQMKKLNIEAIRKTYEE